MGTTKHGKMPHKAMQDAPAARACCSRVLFLSGLATATAYWNNPHANLDPTNSPTQFELSSDALCKVCTRVLLDSVPLMVPLPLHPDPLIPLTQLIDDKAM